MAYAAVVYLLQTLEEYVLQFQYRVIEVKKIQVTVFCKKVHEVLRLFNRTTYLAESRLEQLEKEIESLTQPMETFIEAFRCNENLQPDMLKIMSQIFGIYPDTPTISAIKSDILEEIPQLFHKLDPIKDALEGFLRDTIFYYIWEDPSICLARQRFQKLLNQILSATIELTNTLSFFKQVTRKTISLHGNVCSLLQILQDSDNYELMNQIKTAAERAGDSIEDCLMGNSIVLEMKYFMELSIKGIHLETEVKNFFYHVQELSLTIENAIFQKEKEMDTDFRDLLLKRSWESLVVSKGVLSPKVSRKSMAQTLRENKTDAAFNRSLESSSKQEDVLVGLDDEINKIIGELSGPTSGLQILRIAGMGGIGKTTLARKVFHHPSIVYHFHCLAWVDRVPKIDQVRELLSNLLCSITDEIQGKSCEDLGESLWKSLKGRKYMIVIDDLWNVEAWNAIQRYFPDDKNGSRILITSRFREFPTCVNLKNHYISLLDEERSWELLKNQVFGNGSCPRELVNHGKEIAQNCQGLPLAIVVIAGTLSRIERTRKCWMDIAKSVNSVVCTDPKECLDILALSYNYLPHHLKACFLYMGAFPAYSEIEVWKLISLWIAEGFLDLKSSNNSEEVAENYLEDLIGRSLVLVGKRSFDGKIKTCLIHDLLRELCLREARKENFMHVLETDAQVFPPGINLQRRLIFNLDNCADLELLPSLPHLRSFMWLTLGSDFIPGILVLQLSGFKFLRVLDMFFLLMDAFPVQLLNLVNLRYLALNVTYELQASISELWRLQTLIIYGPWTLGEDGESPILLWEIWSMPWLRHLHVTVPSHLRNPSISEQDLSQPLAPRILQTLSTIAISSCTQEVFSIMPHLKKLGICETKEEYNRNESSECLKDLVYLRELKTLKCSFHSGNREARGLCLDSLPSNLKKLNLSGSRLSWDNMTFLALLPKLEILKLKNHAFQGPKWELTTEVFGCLKQLLIDNTDLVHWEAESTDHFPCLERLLLRSCKYLEKIPCGVGELCILQRIELLYCSESVENSAREFQEQYGIPEVMIRSDYW